nr:hypothetical protein [Bacteroidota bacterium]
MTLIVLLGIPIRNASLFVWIFWLVLAVFGAMHVRTAFVDLKQKYILWVSVLVTLWVLAGFFWYGVADYLGSPFLDGWLYSSFGEYLNRYPKGVEGGLAPLYQYGSILSYTRYVSSAMLAVLIPPWSGTIDTQMTVGPLLIIAIFSFALSVGYAAQIANQHGLNTPVWLVIIFGVVGGWLPQTVHNNNYDNLLALSLAPALFAVACDRNLSRTGQILLPAIFIAASMYIFPELSPLIITSFGVVVIVGLFSYRSGQGNRKSIFNQLLKYTLIAIIALVIVSPYLKNFIYYFGTQLSSSTTLTSGRSGEGSIPGILDPISMWGVMWGLGYNNKLAIAVGLLLGLIALFGVWAAVVKKHFSIILYLTVIIALFVIMVTQKHYDYGAFKILLNGWWAIAIILSAGIKSVWDLVKLSNVKLQYFVRVGIVVMLLVGTYLWMEQSYNRIRSYPYKSASKIREPSDFLLNINEAIQVSVSDPILNAWLVYHLRNENVLFTDFLGYMSHFRPIMARCKTPDSNEIHYLLTDVDEITNGDIVWKNDILKLTRGTPSMQPPAMSIVAPNGREKIGGKPFFWIGREPVSIIFTTSKPTVVQVDFEATVGPSVGESAKDYPNVTVEYANKQLLTFGTQLAGFHTIHVSLVPGPNTFVFRHDYNGKVVPVYNGDPRTLLVGIKILNVIAND